MQTIISPQVDLHIRLFDRDIQESLQLYRYIIGMHCGASHRIHFVNLVFWITMQSEIFHRETLRLERSILLASPVEPVPASNDGDCNDDQNNRTATQEHPNPGILDNCDPDLYRI